MFIKFGMLMAVTVVVVVVAVVVMVVVSINLNSRVFLYYFETSPFDYVNIGFYDAQ